MSELTDRIESRAFWMIDIAPADFREGRIADVVGLEDIVRDCAVHSRGWCYPWVDSRDAPRRYQEKIVSESTFDHHLERWEFHRSGLFVVMHGHPPDWRDESGFWPLRAGEADPRAYVGMTWSLGIVTDFYRFAARLSQSPAGDQEMAIAVTLDNIANRVLHLEDSRRVGFRTAYRYSGRELRDTRIVPRDELLGGSDELAVDVCGKFFGAFGWRTDLRILREIQAQLAR